MVTSMEDTHNVYYPSLAAAVLVLLIGLMTQLFIVVVNIMDWMKERQKTPVDQILTSLGITRVFLHSFSFIDAMCMMFLRSYIGSKLEIFLDLITDYSNLSDIWLGTLFSVCFCMKISNFHNVFFLYLKTLISQRVVHLIISLVIVSIFHISLYHITDHIITFIFLSQNITSNTSHIPEEMHNYIFIAIGNSIPFLIYCTSSLLLIVSLCLHLFRMKSSSNVSTNLDSYYKAIQFMTLCLFGFVLRIGSNIIVLSLYYLDIVWLFMILNSVAILNSIYLIYRTNKLSNQFSKILHHGVNYVFRRGSSVSSCVDPEETTTTL